jgi:phosphoglycolate phosphatase
VPIGQGILETIDSWPADRRHSAHQRLLEHELQACRSAQLVPHAVNVVAAIRQAGLKTALLTRNARAVMEHCLERFGLTFDLTWSREFGPIKPEPAGILRACQALGVAAARTACVGDFHYDILAANAAGAVSVLLARGERPAYADQARHVIAALDELLALLEI